MADFAGRACGIQKESRAALVAPKLMQRYGWHIGDEVALFGV
jgi:hypothetical protein